MSREINTILNIFLNQELIRLTCILKTTGTDGKKEYLCEAIAARSNARHTGFLALSGRDKGFLSTHAILLPISLITLPNKQVLPHDYLLENAGQSLFHFPAKTYVVP